MTGLVFIASLAAVFLVGCSDVNSVHVHLTEPKTKLIYFSFDDHSEKPAALCGWPTFGAATKSVHTGDSVRCFALPMMKLSNYIVPGTDRTTDRRESGEDEREFRRTSQVGLAGVRSAEKTMTGVHLIRPPCRV